MSKFILSILSCFLVVLIGDCVAHAGDAIVESDELIQQLQKQSPKRKTRGFVVSKEETTLIPPSATIYVYFVSGTVDFADERSKQQLDELGRALTSKSLSGARFEISGHTDSVGSDDYNMDLSRKRAKTVNIYLEKIFGYSSSQVTGYGETQPVASNDSQEGRAKNRRVVITRLD